jgi:hypothetical protein
MPDPQGNTTADEESVPATPLHAYKEGREEEIKGNPEKLHSDDPKDLQADELEASDEQRPPKTP